MAKHNEVGEKGEWLAMNHLKEKGFKIIDLNKRFGKLEIDIIAEFENKIIFVEVKTRTSIEIQMPELAVTKRKQNQIIKAAHYWYLENEIDKESRFDIISVHLSQKKNLIRHLESAFYPTIRK